MTRRLLDLLTALSLLLCVALCVLWVRSYWVTDYISYTWLAPQDVSIREDEFQTLSSRGSLHAVRTSIAYEADTPPLFEGVLDAGGFIWEAK